jgi:hypothetical protein
MTHLPSVKIMCRPLKQNFGHPWWRKKKKQSTKKKCRGDIVCENPNNFNLKTPQNIT